MSSSTETSSINLAKDGVRTVLVTGGAGYIGLHVIRALLLAGYAVHVVDDFSNSWPQSLERVVAWSSGRIEFTEGNILVDGVLDRAFASARPYAVIHLAGLKSAPESVRVPLQYWRQNLDGAMHLLEAMQDYGCNRIVFSSTAALYGDEPQRPKCETDQPDPQTPYAKTKLAVESMLADWCRVDAGRTAISLRYFNPIGADADGLIGENARQPQMNLMPAILEVGLGHRQALDVYGNRYPTPDGTGVRDFIHVTDLAEAHVAVLNISQRGADVFNVGTGQGITVLSLVETFERVTGQRIPCNIAAPRPGDIAVSTADPAKLMVSLGWRATRDIDEMCRSAWAWARTLDNANKVESVDE